MLEVFFKERIIANAYESQCCLVMHKILLQEK